jgi:long-chain acyl-CoA synthetase
VGEPLDGVEVKIAEDGEIMVRGPNVFMGYWKNPEATAGVLKDGWLATGDLGVIHDDGAVEITGRKKRAFKLQNGEFVSPEPIENALKSDLIADAVVVGPGRNHVGVVIVVNEMVAKRIAAKTGPLHEDSAVIAAVKKQIDEANKGLTAHRKIKCHFIVDRKLTVGEDGEITPATQKIRPFKVEESFKKKIDAMYEKR